MIEKGLFCEIPPGGIKTADISFTFNTYVYEPSVLVYPGQEYSDVWDSKDLVWQIASLDDFSGKYGVETQIEEEESWQRNEIGEPYLMANGMEVTLKALDIKPHGRGHMISISYRLWNKKGGPKTERGWKIYYEGGGGLDQLLHSEELAFGYIVYRNYKFFIPRGNRPVAIGYPGQMFEDYWATEDLVWFIEDFPGLAIGATELENIVLRSRNVPYPITINSDGSAFFPLTMPVTNDILNRNPLDIFVTDTGGRTSAVKVSIAHSSIEVSPTDSPKGSLVSISGQGFISGKGFFNRKYYVDIFYGVERLTDKIVSRRDLQQLIPVKTIILDSVGAFKTNFHVPSDGLPGSINSIIAKVKGFDIEARVFHEIPSTALTISPNTISAGTDVLVSGIGFPSDVHILKVLIDRVDMDFDSVKTDSYGNFVLRFSVPDDIPSGSRQLVVSSRTFSKVVDVEVQ